MRSNSESFNDGLHKNSRRAEFQRNWLENKKEYQTKEKVSHGRKNKVSGNKTAPRWVYCKFVHWLKERARYWEFERLGNDEMTSEDELIMPRLIEGMQDPAFKHKLLETLQNANLTVEICIESVQQLKLILKKYNQQPNEVETNEMLCKYSGERHVREK